MALLAAKRRKLIALAIVSVVAIAGLLLLQHRREAAVWRFLAAIPGTMTAEKVEAALFSDRVIIHGLRGDFALFRDIPHAVRCERLILDGLNTDAPETLGTVKLVDRVQARGFSVQSTGERSPFFYSAISWADNDIQGLWLNWKAFSGSLRYGSEAHIKALLSFRCGPASMTGAEFSWPERSVSSESGRRSPLPGTVTMTIGKQQSGPLSLTSFGASRTEDVTLHYPGSHRIRARTMHIAEGHNPPSLYRLWLHDDADESGNASASMRLLREGYALKGVVAEGVEIALENVPVVMTIPSVHASFDMGQKDVSISLQADAIKVPAPALMNPDPANPNPAGLGDLRIRCDLDVKTRREPDGTVTFSLRQELDEPRLGAARLWILLTGKEADGPARILPADTATIALKEARLEFKDTGWLDLIFSGLAAGTCRDKEWTGEARADLQKEARMRRAEFARILREESAGKDAGLIRIAEDCAQFVEESGSLEITATAPKAVPLFNLLSDPRGWYRDAGISSERRPPE